MKMMGTLGLGGVTIVYIYNTLKTVFRLCIFYVGFYLVFNFLLLLQVTFYHYIIHIFSSVSCKCAFSKVLFCSCGVV